jgi:hypothetical protein
MGAEGTLGVVGATGEQPTGAVGVLPNGAIGALGTTGEPPTRAAGVLPNGAIGAFGATGEPPTGAAGVLPNGAIGAFGTTGAPPAGAVGVLPNGAMGAFGATGEPPLGGATGAEGMPGVLGAIGDTSLSVLSVYRDSTIWHINRLEHCGNSIQGPSKSCHIAPNDKCANPHTAVGAVSRITTVRGAYCNAAGCQSRATLPRRTRQSLPEPMLLVVPWREQGSTFCCNT